MPRRLPLVFGKYPVTLVARFLGTMHEDSSSSVATAVLRVLGSNPSSETVRRQFSAGRKSLETYPMTPREMDALTILFELHEGGSPEETVEKMTPRQLSRACRLAQVPEVVSPLKTRRHLTAWAHAPQVKPCFIASTAEKGDRR